MNSISQQVMTEVGLGPAGDDARPRMEEMLRETVWEMDGEEVAVVGLALRPASRLHMDPEPDDAFRFPDSSLLLRFGATWLPTDPEGRDSEGSLWGVA